MSATERTADGAAAEAAAPSPAPAPRAALGWTVAGLVIVVALAGLVSVLTDAVPELTEGTHEADGTTMVISRGLGNGIGAVRVNDPRELVILDLVQEADAG